MALIEVLQGGDDDRVEVNLGGVGSEEILMLVKRLPASMAYYLIVLNLIIQPMIVFPWMKETVDQART